MNCKYSQICGWRILWLRRTHQHKVGFSAWFLCLYIATTHFRCLQRFQGQEENKGRYKMNFWPIILQYVCQILFFSRNRDQSKTLCFAFSVLICLSRLRCDFATKCMWNSKEPPKQRRSGNVGFVAEVCRQITVVLVSFEIQYILSEFQNISGQFLS